MKRKAYYKIKREVNKRTMSVPSLIHGQKAPTSKCEGNTEK